MMEERKFTVPGMPQGKMRPRASAFGGHAKVHPDAKQIEYENWMRCCYSEAYPDQDPLACPIEIDIQAYFPIPKSVSKKGRKAMLDGDILPTKKPDLDNIVKNLDALNGIAFEDDDLICEIHAIKLFSEAPRVVITIREMEGERC